MDLGTSHAYRYVNATNVYSAGRVQGQNDVKASPSSYGLVSGTVPVSVSISGSTYIQHNHAASIVCPVTVNVNGQSYSFNATLSYIVAATDSIAVSGSDSRTISLTD